MAAVRPVIDATAIPADLGGVGRYVIELVAGLDRLGVPVSVVVRSRDAAQFGERAPGAEIVVAPRAVDQRSSRLVWEQVGLPELVHRLGASVLHSPHYTMPARGQFRRVVTLHDATFFTDPGVHGRVKRVLFRQAIRRAIAGADALVVPSAATRGEVLRLVGGDPARFHVAHHGVDTTVFRPVDGAERARVAEFLGVGDHPYVAFLGTLEPRKNVGELIRGWAGACADRTGPPDLVLAGSPGWDTRIDAAVDAVPAGLRVHRPGYLPLEDLAGLLSGAVVVAYPSLGEGFGLPVLEAMASGATVLTSRKLSIPEVGGDAVEYCATDASAIGAALGQLLDDPARRAELSARALARAATFTWDQAARIHLASYESALAGPRRR